MPGPSRFGAIFTVTVLSCVVLGAVWGAVISLLPETSSPPELTSRSPSTPAPPPFSPTLNHAAPEPLLHSAPPAMAKEGPEPTQSSSGRRSTQDAVPPAFGMDLKCAMEMDSLCPGDEVDRQICLQRKATHLSIPCRPMLRERLMRMKENRQRMKVACETDRQRYCRDESLGGEAMVQCLESHGQEVSDQCFQFLPKRGRLLN